MSAVKRVTPVASKTDREALKRAEREVMRQEMAVRAENDVSSTFYHYEIGPDGRRYVTGATVTYREKEDGRSAHAGDQALQPPASSGQRASSSRAKSDVPELTDESKARLKGVERDVIAHEAAHKAVGGQYAGPVSYTYATAPDGSRYIVGGEVAITAPEGRTPEETIQIMEQVKRAALAPGSPSAQDMQVAAAASAAQMRAQAELARQAAEKAYSAEKESSAHVKWGEFAISA